MKFLKGLLFTLIALILVYLIIAIFSPNNYSVTRELTVDSSIEAVWNQINTFEKWQNWSPWKQKDSTLTSSFEGTPGEVGSKTSWVGDPELSGTGSMTLKESIPNEKFVYDLEFPEWESTSEGYIMLEDAENGGTKITWNDQGELPFIMRPLGLFGMFDRMMGPDFENGLENMKVSAQSFVPNSKTLTITEIELPAISYLGIRHKTTMAEVMEAEFYSSNYGVIMGALSGNEDKVTGAPVAIYYSWNESDSTTEIVPAIPVNDSTLSYEGTEMVSIPAGKAVKAAYYGPYAGSENAHYALDAYVKEKELKTGLVVEEYANDPTTVASPEEILTNIYYYILEN